MTNPASAEIDARCGYCSAARTNLVVIVKVMSTITVVCKSSLPSLFFHDVFASRHLHIRMLRNDYRQCQRGIDTEAE
jgi:hypothetical protein